MTQTNSGIPPIILDNDDTTIPVLSVTELDESNIDAAVSKLIWEIAQPGYDASAEIQKLSLEDLGNFYYIICTINELLDHDEDVTFKAVQTILATDCIEITPRQYLAASRVHFS